jgi:uncharacterized protein YbjT (DUF2867 family)
VRALIFGATGMVGQSVLRECLLDPEVSEVVTIGRSATGQEHAKLREIVHPDLGDYSAIEGELSGFDACFFCLGIASAGMSEADYSQITHDIPLAAAQVLARLNPAMTFVHISAAGADSSESGRIMWARVKGRTENALLRMPFKGVYIIRPAVIRPTHGVRSRTRLYRILYDVITPVLPVFERLLPRYFTSSETLARAMLTVARQGAPKRVLESDDINRLSRPTDTRT